MPDARDDLSATSEAIQADASAAKTSRRSRNSLDPVDPRVVEPSHQIEALIRRIAHEARAETDLSEGIRDQLGSRTVLSGWSGPLRRRSTRAASRPLRRRSTRAAAKPVLGRLREVHRHERREEATPCDRGVVRSEFTRGYPGLEVGRDHLGLLEPQAGEGRGRDGLVCDSWERDRASQPVLGVQRRGGNPLSCSRLQYLSKMRLRRNPSMSHSVASSISVGCRRGPAAR